MLPRFGTSKLCDTWIVVLLAASIVAWLDGGFSRSWLSLSPDDVIHGQVWRLVTWPLIEGHPLQLIFTCAAIYKFGGELAIRWGDRRLRRFMLEIVIASAAITCVLALATHRGYLVRTGGWAVSDALLIAWARQFPNGTVVLYQLLVLRGRQLITVTVGATVLFAIAFGPVAMGPELCACLLTAGYPRAWLRR
ncbi:MAG: rhomboid family intramembrane serine protease [Deltaproteobacteria bacterium]|nr:rhomboid family intramembrane serine protease [Deltaproteobacteria bacterium]